MPAHRACNTHPLHVGRQQRGKIDVLPRNMTQLPKILFVSFSDAKVFALQQRLLQANLHVQSTCSFRLQMLRGATTVARLRSSASWQTLGTGARTHLTSSAASICKKGLLIAFSSPLSKSGAFRCQQSRQVTSTIRVMAGKARDSLAETNGGAFVRKDSVFRDWIEEGGKFPPEGERNDACQAGLDFAAGGGSAAVITTCSACLTRVHPLASHEKHYLMHECWMRLSGSLYALHLPRLSMGQQVSRGPQPQGAQLSGAALPAHVPESALSTLFFR